MGENIGVQILESVSDSFTATCKGICPLVLTRVKHW